MFQLKTLVRALCLAFKPMYILTPGFENPQQPSGVSETFTPDQLIAGRFPLTTGNGTLTGASALQRGSVLGLATIGSATVATGVQATGTITFSAQPAANDTVTIKGTAITFKAAGSILSGNQVAIGADLTHTVDNFFDFIAASADGNISAMTYSLTGDVITATAKIGGTGGNAYTLAKSSTGIAVSGATLSGGAANTGNGAFAMDGTTPILANAEPGVYSAVCTVAGTNSATFRLTSPKGVVLGDQAYAGSGATLTFADRLKFTITDGGTDFVVGDAFYVTVAGSGKYKLSVPNATDGSQNPTAILVDYADPSSGDVACGVYLTGEFNGNALSYDPGWEPSALVSVLRPLSIFVKGSLPATGTIVNK